MTMLDDLLWRDEGGGQRKLYYVDGIPHIGVGHNLRDRAISDRAVGVIYEDDRDDTMRELDARISWWRTLSERRQAVIVSMAFQMGVDGLLEFHDMLTRARLQQWPEAASAMRDSKWAREQTPARAERLAQIMERDAWV